MNRICVLDCFRLPEHTMLGLLWVFSNFSVFFLKLTAYQSILCVIFSCITALMVVALKYTLNSFAWNTKFVFQIKTKDLMHGYVPRCSYIVIRYFFLFFESPSIKCVSKSMKCLNISLKLTYVITLLCTVENNDLIIAWVLKKMSRVEFSWCFNSPVYLPYQNAAATAGELLVLWPRLASLPPAAALTLGSSQLTPACVSKPGPSVGILQTFGVDVCPSPVLERFIRLGGKLLLHLLWWAVNPVLLGVISCVWGRTEMYCRKSRRETRL